MLADDGLRHRVGAANLPEVNAAEETTGPNKFTWQVTSIFFFHLYGFLSPKKLLSSSGLHEIDVDYAHTLKITVVRYKSLGIFQSTSVDLLTELLIFGHSWQRAFGRPFGPFSLHSTFGLSHVKSTEENIAALRSFAETTTPLGPSVAAAPFEGSLGSHIPVQNVNSRHSRVI